jgi:hypothetical protein
MKNQINILLLLLFAWPGLNLPAQEDCKVLKPEISGQYTGKCKDGLAHGKGKAVGQDTYTGHFSKGLPDGSGTYTWANGDSYTGDWSHGLRDGEGTLKFMENGKETTLAGLWEDDRYIGPVPPKPRIYRCISIDRYTITNSGGLLNRVLINFYQNGTRNLGIESLTLFSSSGTETKLGPSIGYENILFPVTIKVSYTTWNKARTVQVNCVFEFEIFEPGDWVVDLHN